MPWLLSVHATYVLYFQSTWAVRIIVHQVMPTRYKAIAGLSKLPGLEKQPKPTKVLMT